MDSIKTKIYSMQNISNLNSTISMDNESISEHESKKNNVTDQEHKLKFELAVSKNQCIMTTEEKEEINKLQKLKKKNETKLDKIIANNEKMINGSETCTDDYMFTNIKKKMISNEFNISSKIIDKIDPNNIWKYPAIFELFEYNVFKEYDGLLRLIGIANNQGEKNLYKIARLKILKYLITCVENEPMNGDYVGLQNQQLIREAGELLYKYGGIRYMRDRLVWLFIPNRYHYMIYMVWNGIGEWQA